MGYELHIERPTQDSDFNPDPIPFEEWLKAVAAVSGARLFEGPAHFATTSDGTTIAARATPGDVEVYFAEEGRWDAAIYWDKRRGSAFFKVGEDPWQRSNPWLAAAALATELGVVIRGDDGELYDLRTGEIVQA